MGWDRGIKATQERGSWDRIIHELKQQTPCSLSQATAFAQDLIPLFYLHLEAGNARHESHGQEKTEPNQKGQTDLRKGKLKHSS